ncbi:tetratricopeptide repeat protein [Coraliomargarita algicola]|uniref:Tetratricopeptide repeat protein n=1 Tax=Coraliomargarita algicola TaxID=3092156 RepID=A0ABZ0RNI8_9BACT|nr:tetratricopeptide repeat protein [Coraliomargarita sp. J2-16]WPJ97682.1 tetratricopeptide repeat protein [Coraliomargarita sp. J2-16]
MIKQTPFYAHWALVLALTFWGSVNASAQDFDGPASTVAPTSSKASYTDTIESLEEPLYSPFIERYVLDELKTLRSEMAAQKHELMQQILDREHNSVDRAVAYSTDTVTYFFYLIAGVSSILVIMGWSSMRDVQKRIQVAAEGRVTKLIDVYETRLEKLERVVKQKTQHIEENREEIERTQDIQALWLRAGQENSPAQKIALYDEILKHNAQDVEALTYKAHSVLQLDEPQWAANLCTQALDIDAENSQAHYQLARAYCTMGYSDEAIQSLQRAIHFTESYRAELGSDEALKPMASLPEFQKLLSNV